MGKLYEYRNDLDSAEDYYLRALQIDNDHVETITSIGRIYYNKAVYLLNEANSIFDPYTYQEEVDKVKMFFRKSLPYYEEVHKRKPEEREAIIALRGLYYNLNMAAEFDEMDRKMQQL